MTQIRTALFYDVNAHKWHEFAGSAAQRAYDQRDLDPLTVAYIAMGAAKMFDADHADEGESEYIADCIQHAALLDSYAFQVHDTGVNFYYEFAEPFGSRYGMQLLAGEKPNAQAIASAILKELHDAN